MKQYKSLDDLKDDDLLEADIYKTLSSEDAPISFLAEMVDAEGFFNGMEWTYGLEKNLTHCQIAVSLLSCFRAREGGGVRWKKHLN